ncbi:glutathione S-transferase [Xylariales sp. PMI_506]|nr:glutathione S-transferase [Xylariales sp. PMI_506]
MAPFGTVYSYPGNFRVQRAQVAAALNGHEITLEPAFQMGVTNRSPEFLAKFPMGRVPVFEGADGFCLAEGAAICQYLAASGPKADQLLGAASDPKTRGLIAQWSFFAENELAANWGPIAGMVHWKYAPFDEKRYSVQEAAVERALRRLDLAVKGKKFLVGDALTVADIMVAGALVTPLQFLIDAEMRSSVAPETTRWLEGLWAEVPEFKTFFGELTKVDTRVKKA